MVSSWQVWASYFSIHYRNIDNSERVTNVAQEPNLKTGFGIQFCKYSVEEFLLFVEIKISLETELSQGSILIFCNMIAFTKSQISLKDGDFISRIFGTVQVSHFLYNPLHPLPHFPQEAHVFHIMVTKSLFRKYEHTKIRQKRMCTMLSGIIVLTAKTAKVGDRKVDINTAYQQAAQIYLSVV